MQANTCSRAFTGTVGPNTQAITSVDATTNFFTKVAHGFLDGDVGAFTTTNLLPAPLALATNYYIVNKTADTFQVSSTLGGTAIDLTDVGVGTHTFTIVAHEIDFVRYSANILIDNPNTTKNIQFWAPYSYSPTNVITWSSQYFEVRNSQNISFDLSMKSVRIYSTSATTSYQIFVIFHEDDK